MDLTTPHSAIPGDIHVGAVLPTGLVDVSVEQWRAVVEMTTNIFGPTTIEERIDREYPFDKYVLLTVEPAGESRGIVAMEGEWIRRLHEIVPPTETIRLLILPRA